MPRSRRAKAQNLTVREKEKYFIGLYVKAGAVEQKIAYCEQRAFLKPGTGTDGELLEGALMRLVVGLDWEKHPKVKLEAIKAAFVVNGTLEIKSTGWLSRRTSLRA